MRSSVARRLIATVVAVLLFAVGAAMPGPRWAAADGAISEEAADLKKRILEAIEKPTAPGLNDALELVAKLEKACADDAAREAVGFAALAVKTTRARDGFFRKEIGPCVVAEMEKRILAQAKEQRPARKPGAAKLAGPEPGTVAAARKWAATELPKLLWEAAAAQLELKPDEVERFWKERIVAATSKASYGTGTFAASTRGGAQPGARNVVNEGDLWAWWEERAKRPQERAAWLTAWFVESSGLFEIRVDESERCSGCGGTGVLRTMNADGTTSSLGCPTCRGAAKVRVLEFR